MATPSRPCLIGSEEAFELLEGLQQAAPPGALEQQQQHAVLVPAQPAGFAEVPGQEAAQPEPLPCSPAASPAVCAVEGPNDSQTPGHVLLPVPVSPPSEPPNNQEQQQEAAVALPLRAKTSLAQAYLRECRGLQVDPHCSTLQVFNTVPESLRVTFQPRVMPRTHAGGAVLLLNTMAAPTVAGEQAAAVTASGNGQQQSAPPSQLQLLAALWVLFGKQDAGDSEEPFRLLLLHHLDLSGTQLGPVATKHLLGSGERLRHWHTLASLGLSGCGLHRDFFSQVGCADSLSFYRSLTRLDLSHNPLGTAPEGQPVKAYDALNFAFMWREAPLEYLNLAYTGLTATDLDHLLWRLCDYGPLRDSSGQAVGPAPTGTRASLRYLELGPPGGGDAWDDNLVVRLQRAIQAVPLLERLVLHGLTEEAQQQQLAAAWRAAKADGAECHSGMLPGQPSAFCLSTLPLEQRCSVEVAPQEHVLPGPDTPPPAQQLGVHDEANFLGGGSAERAQLNNPGPHLVQQRIDTMPAIGQAEGAADVHPGLLPRQRPKPLASRPPRAQGQAQQHAQLHQALQATGGGRQRARTEEPPVRETVAMLQQQITFRRQQSQQHALGGDMGRSGAEAQSLGQPSGQQRATGRRGSGTKRSQQAHRAGRAGGGRADQLPSFEIDLMQDSPPDAAGVDDYYDDDEDEADSGEEDAQLKAQQARDREIADDDKMAPIYRKEVKAMISQIEDAADREEASKMYKVYNTASYAWDRRRWQNPDKQFPDQPQQLGALNRLYDLLEARRLRPRFPFPLRQPGGGRQAYEQPSPKRVASRPARPPPQQEAAAAAPQRAEASEDAAAALAPAPRQAKASGDAAAETAVRRQRRKQEARRAAQLLVDAGSESESEPDSPQASQDSFLAPDGLQEEEEEADGDMQGLGLGVEGASPAVVDLLGGSSPSGAGQPQQLECAATRTTAAASRRKHRVVDLSDSDSSEGEDRSQEPQTIGVRAADGNAASHERPPQTTELKLRYHHQLASLPLPSPVPPPVLSPAANGATGAPLGGTNTVAADLHLGHAPPAVHTDFSQRLSPRITDASPPSSPGPHPAPGAGGGRHKKSRELESLIPFEWDKYKQDHPPNAEVFGLAEGKRQRRALLPDSQLQRLLDDSQQREAPPSQAESDLWEPEEDSDEPLAARAELGTEDEPLAKRWKQQQQRVSTSDANGSQLDDSDDDLPLGQLAAKQQAGSSRPAGAQQTVFGAQQEGSRSDSDLQLIGKQPSPVGQLPAPATLAAQGPHSPGTASKVVAGTVVQAGLRVPTPSDVMAGTAVASLTPATAAHQVDPAPGLGQAVQSPKPFSAVDLAGLHCLHSGPGKLPPLAAAAAEEGAVAAAVVDGACAAPAGDAGLASCPPAHEGIPAIEAVQPGCRMTKGNGDQQVEQQLEQEEQAPHKFAVPELAGVERPAAVLQAADNHGQKDHSTGQPDIPQVLCIPDSEEQEMF